MWQKWQKTEGIVSIVKGRFHHLCNMTVAKRKKALKPRESGSKCCTKASAAAKLTTELVGQSAVAGVL